VLRQLKFSTKDKDQIHLHLRDLESEAEMNGNYHHLIQDLYLIEPEIKPEVTPEITILEIQI